MTDSLTNPIPSRVIIKLIERIKRIDADFSVTVETPIFIAIIAIIHYRRFDTGIKNGLVLLARVNTRLVIVRRRYTRHPIDPD